jgi:hypothetical protein
MNTFESFQAFHIYREFNKEVDALSKKTSVEPEGLITLHLWKEGGESQRQIIKIY